MLATEAAIDIYVVGFCHKADNTVFILQTSTC